MTGLSPVGANCVRPKPGPDGRFVKRPYAKAETPAKNGKRVDQGVDSYGTRETAAPDENYACNPAAECV